MFSARLDFDSVKSDTARAWKEAHGKGCRAKTLLAKVLWPRMQDQDPIAKEGGKEDNAGCDHSAEIIMRHLAANRSVFHS